MCCQSRIHFSSHHRSVGFFKKQSRVSDRSHPRPTSHKQDPRMRRQTEAVDNYGCAAARIPHSEKQYHVVYLCPLEQHKQGQIHSASVSPTLSNTRSPPSSASE